MTRKNAALTTMGVATCAVAVLLSGCAATTSQQKGAGTGAVIGAVAGQVLGRDSKSTVIGAGREMSPKMTGGFTQREP